MDYKIYNNKSNDYQATTEDGNNTAALFATLKFKARSNLHFEFKFCVSFCEKVFQSSGFFKTRFVDTFGVFEPGARATFLEVLS